MGVRLESYYLKAAFPAFLHDFRTLHPCRQQARLMHPESVAVGTEQSYLAAGMAALVDFGEYLTRRL
jgi:hypothetical protein